MGRLPRLALVSEVPPLSLSAGPAVLYRLLQQYPAELLLLCEDAGLPRYPDSELTGVSRRRLPFNWTRLMRSRFGHWHGPLALALGPALLTGRIASALRDFRAEAVLSVAHGHIWWPAYRAACQLNLPFHLIIHDHWRDCLALPSWLDQRATHRFTAAYRGAATRFVVSPAMARRYESAYGAKARLLYPSQHRDAEVHLRAPAHRTPPFVFAYAGGMDGQWARRAVIDLAHAIAPSGARVRVYQSIPLDRLRSDGLRTDNIDIQPFLPALELHRHLRDHADAMFLPMSFDPADRTNVEVCFPSKLTDYTVPALPMLVYAPPYSSAVEWLKANPSAALLVDRPEPALLHSAATQLISHPELRSTLGAAAATAGQRDFAADQVFSVLAGALDPALQTISG